MPTVRFAALLVVAVLIVEVTLLSCVESEHNRSYSRLRDGLDYSRWDKIDTDDEAPEVPMNGELWKEMTSLKPDTIWKLSQSKQAQQMMKDPQLMTNLFARDKGLRDMADKLPQFREYVNAAIEKEKKGEVKPHLALQNVTSKRQQIEAYRDVSKVMGYLLGKNISIPPPNSSHTEVPEIVNLPEKTQLPTDLAKMKPQPPKSRRYELCGPNDVDFFLSQMEKSRHQLIAKQNDTQTRAWPMINGTGGMDCMD